MGLLAVLAVGLVAAGCGAASADREDGLASDFDVIGGTDPEVALLTDIIERTKPRGLSAVSIGSVPEDSVPAAAGVVEGTEWLTFEHVVGADEESLVDAWWRSAIIATAFRRAAKERGLPLIRGYTALSRSPDGQVVDEETLPISAELFEWDGTAPSEDAEPLRTSLSQVGTGNLSLLSFEVVRPGGAAVIITLEARDPKAFLDGDTGDVNLALTSDLEGSFVRVVDPNGELVWMRAGANRAGHSKTWTRPDLQGDT